MSRLWFNWESLKTKTQLDAFEVRKHYAGQVTTKENRGMLNFIMTCRDGYVNLYKKISILYLNQILIFLILS